MPSRRPERPSWFRSLTPAPHWSRRSGPSKTCSPRLWRPAMPSDHPFDSVMLYPGRGYRETCGVCGKLKSEHPEVQSADEMRRLLRELADCLCGLKIVNRVEKQALLDRLAKY